MAPPLPPKPPTPSQVARKIREELDEGHHIATCGRTCRAGWTTAWQVPDDMAKHIPPHGADFRDYAPDQLSTVYELYKPVVQDGKWTHGLLEMWFRKQKVVKHSVHVPCWESFKWNPCKWRGIVLGRTVEEFLWTTKQARWARNVYAANLGREYVMPVRNVGRHGYKSDIKALCLMYYLMSCIFSCGIGQLASCCGSSAVMNFGAWYSCHARERIRRRYKLPPMCGLPPGIDDCLVHFFCFYCAAHQEARELALRGVDGPGMHILDVLPHSWDHVEGIEEVKAERRAIVESMLKKPPKMFKARRRQLQKQQAEGGGADKTLEDRVAAAAVAMIGGGGDDDLPLQMQDSSRLDSGDLASSGSFTSALGWARYSAPEQQEMDRGPSMVEAELPPLWRHSVHEVPVLQEEANGEMRQLQRAWSVAY